MKLKHVKTFENFKINETGEWARDVDWEFVKNNPDADDEFSSWIRELEKLLNEVKQYLDDKSRLEIIDIEGFDKYQGPYAQVEIDGKNYEVWTTDEPYMLWIEDYPIDNTSEEGLRAGFKGEPIEIAQMLNDNKK